MTAQSKSENERIANRILEDSHKGITQVIELTVKALDAKDAKIAELEGKIKKLTSIDYTKDFLDYNITCSRCDSLQQLLGKCKFALNKVHLNMAEFDCKEVEDCLTLLEKEGLK